MIDISDNFVDLDTWVVFEKFLTNYQKISDINMRNLVVGDVVRLDEELDVKFEQ